MKTIYTSGSIMSQKLFARGVVSAMNPTFKMKSGMSAANKALKNNLAVKTGGYVQNIKQGYRGGVAEISGKDLPKGGLFHPSGRNIIDATPYVRNKGTRIQSGSSDLIGIVPSKNFKEFDSVSQLKTGRQHSRASAPQQMDNLGHSHPAYGRGSIATLKSVAPSDSPLRSSYQKRINTQNLHTAINARGAGDSLGNYNVSVSGMKARSVSHRLGYMNPIKQVFGGKKELQGKTLNQLFRS